MSARPRLWVVKLGSGLLTAQSGKIDQTQINQLVAQISAIRKNGVQVVLVSSGAVSAGMTALELPKRPKSRTALQACATIGQSDLINAYQKALRRHGMIAAQILLTYWDLDSRKIYENTQSTLKYLLRLKNCLPIVNENDAISFDELEMLNRFGDNDRLSAHVAQMLKAKQLIILSGIDGLYTSLDKEGILLKEVHQIDEKIKSYAGQTKSQRSVGGMISKLETAKMMMKAKIPMVIANGRHKGILEKLAQGEKWGTRFSAANKS
ncbi:MAG: glutamate 5-kinase [Verrucomicrobiota bacterium]